MQVQPSQVSPGESFDIYYFVRNHTDGNTYYIRAVVYDVRTGEVLATHNLDQSATNARLFIKSVSAPADPTGYGRNIVAIATVYTDSGYTTKSENYEEQEQYYLVKALQFTGGGGGSIDYRIIADIIDGKLEKRLKELPKAPDLKVPDQPDMSFVDGLFGTLGAIVKEINRIPKEQPDHAPLQEQLTAIKALVSKIPTAQEKTDLSPVMRAFATILKQLVELRKAIVSGNNDAIGSLQQSLEASLAEMQETLKTTVTETIQGQSITLPFTLGGPKKAAEPEVSPIDSIGHLVTR